MASNRARLLIAISVVLVVSGFFLCTSQLIAQDQTYHFFADSRTILGIPNFWNVASKPRCSLRW